MSVVAAISQRANVSAIGKSLRETLPVSRTCLLLSSNRVYRVAFLFLLSTLSRQCIRVYTCIAAAGSSSCRRTRDALGTRSISVPRLPARHNYFAKHRFATVAPTAEGDRTKSARACGTSAEEIFLTARCHRVRPTEITDEDSERSSTPVTVQERAGGRSPPFAGHYRVRLNERKGGKNMISRDRKYNRGERYGRIRGEIVPRDF